MSDFEMRVLNMVVNYIIYSDMDQDPKRDDQPVNNAGAYIDQMQPQPTPSEQLQPPQENPQLPSLENIEQQYEQNILEYSNPIKYYNDKIRSLQQKQEILKYSVAEHQQKVKQIFMDLHNKKKQLLQYIINEHNQQNLSVDISILEEFEHLKATIENQEHHIQSLRDEIEKLGLGGVDSNKDTIEIKKRRAIFESEIEVGRKFAATQYVRDYLEKTHIYKVSYEDVRYEYEMKMKLKDYLQNEKRQYERKKQQNSKAIQTEAAIYEQLLNEHRRLMAQQTQNNDNKPK